MTESDRQTAYAAADLRDVGSAMQALLGRDMTLEAYLTGSPSPQSLSDWVGATVLVAQADSILKACGVSPAMLYD